MVQQMSNVHISSPAGQPPVSQQQTPGWPPQPSSNSMVGYKIVCYGDKVYHVSLNNSCPLINRLP